MNAVEKLLTQGLESDPEDVSIRLELAEKLAARGAADELGKLIEQSPNAPESAGEMHRFLELAAENQVETSVVNEFVAKFVSAHPADGWGHHVYALGLSRAGEDEKARRHYDAARKLNPEVRDAALEAALDDTETEAPHPMTAPVKVRSAATAEPTEEEIEAVLAEIDEPDVAPPAAQEPVAEAVADSAVEVEPEVVAELEPEPEPEPEALPVPAARPLRPRSELDAEEEEVVPMAIAESVVAAEVAPAEFAEGGEELGHEHYYDEHGREFIVGEGELVHAHDKDPDTKEKLSALTVAILVHVGLIALIATVVIALPPKDPPLIVGNHLANLEDQNIETEVVEKKIRQAPVQSASAQVEVMTVTGASSVAIPDITTDLDSFEPIGIGDSFGMSMSFDAGEDGGMVSFFGARSVSKRVVFVVDYSASMRGEKDKLMRKELKKSVEALPSGVEYQLIFFSGPAWYAGQEVKKGGDKKDEWYNDWVVDGSKEFKWYGGWDEKDRKPRGGKTSILFHYSEGDDKLPTADYIKATRSNIRKSIKHVDGTPLTVGTDWRSPLMMAMNMEPDTIYFMTDGAFGTAKGVSKKEMIDDLLSYNRKKSRAKINTICMMVLQARTELEQLAEGSRGEFSLVKEDGSVVRGRDLDAEAKKKKAK